MSCMYVAWRLDFIFQDNNGVLTADEYVIFHKRLLRVVEHAGGGVIMDEAASKEAMEADFKADSGDDGSVNREEFRYALFQLADQWTFSLEEAEYVVFLRTGYKLVFSDLIEGDKPRPPAGWGDNKKVRNPSPMVAHKAVNIMTTIIFEKTKADLIARDNGATFDDGDGNKNVTHFGDFTIGYFLRTFGPGEYKKSLKLFTAALLKLLAEENNPVHDFSLMFAQMCGFDCKSGRVEPLPERATAFVLSHLDGVTKILHATSLRIGSSIATPAVGDKKKMVTCARGGAIVTGFLDLEDTRIYLAKVLTAELGLDKTAPLFKVAQIALESLSSPVAGDAKRPLAVPCSKFASLLAVLFTAEESSIVKRPPSNIGFGFGTAKKVCATIVIKAKKAKSSKKKAARAGSQAPN